MTHLVHDQLETSCITSDSHFKWYVATTAYLKACLLIRYIHIYFYWCMGRGGFDRSNPFFLKASFKQYCSLCRCSVMQQNTSYCFCQSGLLHYVLCRGCCYHWIQSSIYLEHIRCEWFLMNKKITLLIVATEFIWLRWHWALLSALLLRLWIVFRTARPVSHVSQIWKLGFIVSH